MPRKVSELSGGTQGQRGALGRDPRERVLGAPERTQLLGVGRKARQGWQAASAQSAWQCILMRASGGGKREYLFQLTFCKVFV